MPDPGAPEIAAAALDLIRDPARFTDHGNSRTRADQRCPGAADEAVCWSALGAVSRVRCLEFNTRELMDAWREVDIALRARGVTHRSSHAEAVAALTEIANQEDVA